MYATLLGMTESQYRAVEIGLVPRAPKTPAGFEMLSAVADLSFCPVRSVERRARVDHLACLISETLVAEEI